MEQPIFLKDVYPRYQIGEGTYGDLLVFDWPKDPGQLEIGAYTSFAFGCKLILGGEHNLKWCSTYPFPAVWPEAADIPGHPTTKGPVKIGSDVWVGAETLILSGVTIGHGAVIGARSVVSRDVPPYAIASGNPAQLRSWRFDEAQIESLLAIEWWNWPREKIAAAMELLLQPDVDRFIFYATSNKD